jgi:hypothetical protein
MDDPVSIVAVTLIAACLLSIPVMIVISLRRLAQRTRDLRRFAADEGFEFRGKQPLPEELRPLPYFRQGIQLLGRRTRNMLRRDRNGEETLIFDYWYLVTSGNALRTNRTTRATVICLRRGAGSWAVFAEEDLGYLPVTQLPEFLTRSRKHSQRAEHPHGAGRE